jgi:hypothetical protein
MSTWSRFWRRSALGLVLLVVGLVALADSLFYEHVPGWTLGLFVAALGDAILLRSTRLRGASAVVAVTAWMGLLLALVVDPSRLACALAVVLLAILSTLGADPWDGRVSVWLSTGSRLALRGWMQVFHDARLLRRRRRGQDRPAQRLLAKAYAHWALPVALTLVFLGLFALANPVIRLWLTRCREGLSSLLQHLALPEPKRIAFWLLTGLLCWALLRNRARRALAQQESRAALTPPGPCLPAAWGWVPVPPPLDLGTGAPAAAVTRQALVTRCLVLFNVLFLVQNILDVRYLWGGSELPSGLTYAQYAHRGAYPLVATALLAALFVLVAFLPAEPMAAGRLRRRLVYAWLLQNVFLTAAAAFRLGLYVAVYSLTRLRVAAGIWMLLVGVGLLLIVWRIARRHDNEWLLKANLVALVGLLYLCCFANLDGRIAWYNARHCAETASAGPALDFDYLEVLGPDALPALTWYRAQPGAAARATASAATAAALRKHLSADLAEWRGWTWHRARLARRGEPLRPPD